MRPLLLITTLLPAACAAPSAAPRPPGPPAVSVLVVPRLQPAEARALLAFSPYSGADLARITLALEDVTGTPTTLASDHVVGASGQFLLQDLRPYRLYRLRLQGFHDAGGLDLISLDDMSSATLDTTPTASGTLATVRSLSVPLRLAPRPFRGALDAVVQPAAGQQGMVVRLQRQVGAQWVDQLATDVVGAASSAVAFEGLALDARYRLLREGYTGASPALTLLADGEASLVVDTASTAVGVLETGELASVTLGGPP